MVAAKNVMNFREIDVYKPLAREFPADLLVAAGADAADLTAWSDAETLRLASRGQAVLGGYAMNRLSVERFELLGVVVEEGHRTQGLGRWLVGHALGVAESKGGQEVVIANPGNTAMFTQMGFSQRENVCLYELVPESLT